MCGEQSARRGDPVDARHPDVHEHEVRSERLEASRTSSPSVHSSTTGFEPDTTSRIVRRTRGLSSTIRSRCGLVMTLKGLPTNGVSRSMTVKRTTNARVGTHTTDGCRRLDS
jgi:hypothetical protein